MSAAVSTPAIQMHLTASIDHSVNGDQNQQKSPVRILSVKEKAELEIKKYEEKGKAEKHFFRRDSFKKDDTFKVSRNHKFNLFSTVSRF